MNTLFENPLFGITLTVAAYTLALIITRRFKSQLLHPIWISALFIIVFLLGVKIPLSSYQRGGDLFLILLFPATTSLALIVYEQKAHLKKNLLPIGVGTVVGSLSSLFFVRLFSRLVGLEKIMVRSLIPKSVTSAVALELSLSLDGIPSFTLLSVMITGLSVTTFIAPLFRLFKITNSVEKGIALGVSAHIIGTSKALEIGKEEGSLSAISLFFSAIITTLLTLLFH